MAEKCSDQNSADEIDMEKLKSTDRKEIVLYDFLEKYKSSIFELFHVTLTKLLRKGGLVNKYYSRVSLNLQKSGKMEG